MSMGSTSASARDPLTIARTFVVVAGAAALAWFVGTQGIAAVAARSMNTALLSRFDPGTYPEAGTRLAQINLEQGHADRAAALARPAALANPLSVRAVRVLGLSLNTNNKVEATRVMRVAEKLSRRDTPTSMWALLDAGLAQDLPRLLDQIDALARRQVQPEVTSKLFYAGLSDAISRHAFAGLLARNPPWRSSFFANIRVNLPSRSFQEMELLLDQLDRTNAPASPEERLTFIDRMEDRGEGRRAWAYWIRSFNISPARRGQTPYDPQFRAVAARRSGTSISPFEWAINQDASQFVGFGQGDRGPTLDVTPGAEDGTALLSQILLLASGSHRIDTMMQGPIGQAPAGWQLACAQSGTPLIRTFARPGDELSGVTIDVPADGCSTQRLTLTANGRIGARPVSIQQVTIR